MSSSVNRLASTTVTNATELQKGTNGAAHVVMGAAYPPGAVVLNPSSGNVANASAVATLAAAAGTTTYITGFEITGAGATAGLVVNPTVVGTIGGTMTYTYAAATGALVANTPLIVEFNPAIPASAVNTTIVVTVPALGVGNTNSTVVTHGYRI